MVFCVTAVVVIHLVMGIVVVAVVSIGGIVCVIVAGLAVVFTQVIRQALVVLTGIIHILYPICGGQMKFCQLQLCGLKVSFFKGTRNPRTKLFVGQKEGRHWDQPIQPHNGVGLN